jgi:hypothetical protein
MASQVQYRRGTNAQNAAFTGALAEITVDTTNGTLRVHDAITVGGSNIATVAYVTSQISALSSNSISSGTSNIRVTGTDANIAANVGATSNVLVLASTGAFVTGLISATGNITAGGATINGDLTVTGNATLSGNIVGDRITNGTTSIEIQTASGNANVSVGGTSNVAVFATTGLFVTGLASVTGGVTAASVAGGVITGTSTSVSGTVTAASTVGGVITGTSASVSGGVTAASVAGGVITGTSTSVTGTQTAASTVGGVITGSSASVSGTVTAASVVGGVITGSSVSVSGAQTAASTVGGVITGSSVSVSGTVTAASTVGGVITGTSTSVSGGVTAASVAGGVITGSSASVTGAVTGASLVGTITTAAQTNITSVGTLGALSVTGNITFGGSLVDTGALEIVTGSNGNITLSPNGSGLIVANKDIRNGQANGVGNIGTVGGFFNTIFAKSTSAQYADLAEKYTADAGYPAGTVMEFGGPAEVTQSSHSHSTRVAGIVSTNPSYLMNATLSGDHVLPVALTGRVPCRVVGTIAKGDRLVTSDIPGVATVLDMNQYLPACIIGKALQNYDSTETGTIEVAVGRT